MKWPGKLILGCSSVLAWLDAKKGGFGLHFAGPSIALAHMRAELEIPGVPFASALSTRSVDGTEGYSCSGIVTAGSSSADLTKLWYWMVTWAGPQKRVTAWLSTCLGTAKPLRIS